MDVTAAEIKEQDVARQVRQAMMAADLAALPIRGIEKIVDKVVGFTIDTVCGSSETAGRVCAAASEGLSYAVEAITPTSLLNEIESGKTEIVASLHGEHEIAPEDSEYALGSAGKVGTYLVTVGAGGLVIKVGKTAVRVLKRYRHHIRHRNAHLPEIEGIRFDAKTAQQRTINWESKAALDVITVKGTEKSRLIFIDNLSKPKSRKKINDRIMERAFGEVEALLQKRNVESVFVQFLPANKKIPRFLTRQGYEYLGKFPFEMSKHRVFINTGITGFWDGIGKVARTTYFSLPSVIRTSPQFPVFRVGRKTTVLAIPTIAGAAAAMAASCEAAAAAAAPEEESADVMEMMRALEESSGELVEMNGRLLGQWMEDSPQLEQLRVSASGGGASGGSKASDQVDRQSYDAICQRVYKDARNLAGIVGSFGSSSDACDMVLLADTSYTMATEIGGLTGLGEATTDPFSATLAIVNCVGGLIKGFSRKKKAGPSALQKQMEAIFAQLKAMRQQLEEIDRKAEQILAVCVEGFSSTFSTLQHHTWQLRNLGKKLDRMDQKMVDQFAQIASHMRQVLGAMQGFSKCRLVEDITGELFLFLDEKNPDSSRYKERVEFLKKYACHTAKQQTYSRAAMTTDFSFRDYEFSIQNILGLFGISLDELVPNPQIYTMGALGILFLTIRQYPSIELPPLSRICIVDIGNLKGLLVEGQNLQNALKQLQIAGVRDAAILQYRQVWDNLVVALTDAYAKIEKERKEELFRSSYVSQLARHRSEYVNGAFHKALGVAANPPGTNWFRGGHSVHYPHNNGVKMRGPINEHIARGEYLKAMEGMAKASRDSYWQARVGVVSGVHQKKAESSGIVELPWVILPMEPTFPALPVPSFIAGIIPEDCKRAVQNGLGVLDMQYEINAARKFVIHLSFNKDTDSAVIPISQIETDYDPLFYTGPEAVWWFWVGGTIAVSQSGAMQKFHHDNGSGTADWLTHLPQKVQRQGAIKRVNAQNVKITPNGGAPAQLHELLTEHKQAERRYMFEKLFSEFSIEHRELMEAFDASYQKLMGLFALTCKDQLEGEASTFSSTVREVTPYGHFTALSTAMQSDKSDRPFAEVLGTVTTVMDRLSDLPSLEGVSGTNNAMLDFTVGMLEFLIAYYEPHAVKWNRWNEAPASHEFRDTVLAESLKTIGGLLNLAKDGRTVDSAAIVSAIAKLHDTAKNAHEGMDEGDQGQAAEVLRSLLGNMGPLLTDR